jgi:hypothetical protein
MKKIDHGVAVGGTGISGGKIQAIELVMSEDFAIMREVPVGAVSTPTLVLGGSSAETKQEDQRKCVW